MLKNKKEKKMYVCDMLKQLEAIAKRAKTGGAFPNDACYIAEILLPIVPKVLKNNKPPILGFRKFRKNVKTPSKATKYSAGWDLYAWVEDEGEVILEPGDTKIIKTGLNLRIPKGYKVIIQPRSGLAAKYGITILNSPGLIDADYDGDDEDFEIKIILHNAGKEKFVVKHHDKIAQMCIEEVPEVEFREFYEKNENRNDSERQGGLGSTGNK